MSEHQNADLMRRSYQVLEQGDVAFLEATATETFTMEVSGTSAISGTAQGVRGAVAEFRRSAELAAG